MGSRERWQSFNSIFVVEMSHLLKQNAVKLPIPPADSSGRAGGSPRSPPIVCIPPTHPPTHSQARSSTHPLSDSNLRCPRELTCDRFARVSDRHWPLGTASRRHGTESLQKTPPRIARGNVTFNHIDRMIQVLPPWRRTTGVRGGRMAGSSREPGQ